MDKKLPKIIKGEMTVGEGQIRVQINPRKKAFKVNRVDNSKIDIIRLLVTSLEGNEQELYMTPDEALEISGYLTHAVQFWLLCSSKGYRQDILKNRKSIESKRLKAHV